MGHDVTLIARPIDVWPGELTSRRRPTDFTADWGTTVALLEREVWHIAGDGAEVVLQLAITERDCRNDGWIRSDAKPEHPGVIVSFTDAWTNKPLRFSCDEFEGRGYGRYLNGWKSNVRAIALGLEHLRALERYGLGSGHEQYVGWQQLGTGDPVALGAGMTAEDAARALLDAAGLDTGPENISKVIRDRDYRRAVYREAQKVMHPDNGGTEEASALVNQANDLLRQVAP